MTIGQEGQGLMLAGFADEATLTGSELQRTSCLCRPHSGITSTVTILGVEPRSSSLHGKHFTDSSISPVLKFRKENCFNNFFPVFRGDSDLTGWPSAR